jgi:hypothetical protein
MFIDGAGVALNGRGIQKGNAGMTNRCKRGKEIFDTLLMVILGGLENSSVAGI